jgi:hypothetical protein
MSGPVLIAFLAGVFLWGLGGVIASPAALALRIAGAVAWGLALLLAVLPVLHAAG